MNKKKNTLLILLLIIPLISIMCSKIIFSKVNLEHKKDVNVANVKNENSKDIKSFMLYSIQVGLLKDYEKVKLVISDLDENQIPNYIQKKDELYKIYSYTFLDENQIRNFLTTIRGNYTDAFIVKNKIPSIKFKYTDKYKDIGLVVDTINMLIDNFYKESYYWYCYDAGTSKYEQYIEVINERKKIVESLTKSEEKIKFNDLEKFENSLKSLNKELSENLNEINYNLSKNNMYNCQKYFLKTIYAYDSFIKKMNL